MPTSISHIGGRARVNEPGRYRKKNNKNLMVQGLPTYVGMPQPLRNLIAKRVKSSQAAAKKKSSQGPSGIIIAAVDLFDYNGLSQFIKLRYKTDIQGAKITLTGKIDGVTKTLITQTTLAVTIDDLNNFSTQPFDSNLTADPTAPGPPPPGLLNDESTVSDIKLTLTGGKISNINHTETTIGVSDFTVIRHNASYSSGEVTDAAPTKIILAFDNPIAVATLVVTDFSIQLDTQVGNPAVAAVVGGKVELIIPAGLFPSTAVAAVTNSQEITVGYTKSGISSQNITDIYGNIIPTFGGDPTEFRSTRLDYGVVINRVGPPILWPPRLAARVDSDAPSHLILTLTKPIVTISSVNLTDFVANPVYTSGTPTNIELLSNGKVKLTLPAPVNGGQGTAVTVAFTKTSTVLEDAAGLQLVNFTAQQVLNRT